MEPENKFQAPALASAPPSKSFCLQLQSSKMLGFRLHDLASCLTDGWQWHSESCEITLLCSKQPQMAPSKHFVSCLLHANVCLPYCETNTQSLMRLCVVDNNAYQFLLYRFFRIPILIIFPKADFLFCEWVNLFTRTLQLIISRQLQLKHWNTEKNVDQVV